jgi:transposase
MDKPIIDLSSVTTVGLDLAKHVFQVHCVDASGRVIVAKAIRRGKLLEFFAFLRDKTAYRDIVPRTNFMT